MHMNSNPEIYHESIYKNIKPLLKFDESRDYCQWKNEVGKTLSALLKVPEKKIQPYAIIEYEKEHNDFREIRFKFESETNYFVPCHLLIPETGKKKYPLMICLQGHATGMHISLGISKYPHDDEVICDGDRDFALRSVKEGFCALVMEQRAFGECLGGDGKEQPYGRCHQASMQALLLGRTLIGERVFDISRAIDVASQFDMIDTDKICCMGNSGGGTATFYAAAVDERICAAMPSCAFTTYEASIFGQFHCQCNYIPDIMKYFDMGDITCLIAPRSLVIVSGIDDPIFPIEQAKSEFERVKKIYASEGAKDKCRHVIGNGGHRFYADDAWPVFKEICGFEI